MVRDRQRPARCAIEFESADPSNDALVLEYLSLVKSIAWQIYGSLPYHAMVELNDIVQAGHLGLINASQTFRADLNVPFASYARHRIRGEILDSLRRMDGASRNLRGWQRRIDSSVHDLGLLLSREPTDEEIGARLGVGVARLRTKRLALWRALPCSYSQVVERESDFTAGGAVPDGRPDFIQQRRQMAEVLQRAVSRLPPRSKKVIEWYYLRDLPMKQIGRLLKVNESRISQIHKSALQLMARELKASGIQSATDI